MAGRQTHVTRTLGPIHFEDLDPRRFEDLVRELIYRFRDWQTIEATGRTGKDAGFDIRAYERSLIGVEGQTEDEDPPHPMDGNRWMIQGKREKELGPADLRKILGDVDNDDPPYGYILAASANFSKDSFDIFREVLRSKGVMEIYLWGKPELEDMLHLPKNDRILFTFFGLSLTSKRRTRATEVRSLVITKNKLIKLLGTPEHEFNKEILLRDINDEHYPYRREYADFASKPRCRFNALHSGTTLAASTFMLESFTRMSTGARRSGILRVKSICSGRAESQTTKGSPSKPRKGAWGRFGTIYLAP